MTLSVTPNDVAHKQSKPVRQRRRTRGGQDVASGRVPHRGTDASQVPDLQVYGGESEVRPDQSGRVPDASRTHDDCRYVDIGQMLDGGIPDPPTPDICLRNDGIGLFYQRQVNNVFGDPESGKTLLCDYATVEVLKAGGGVLRLDLDHNGPESTVSRLIDFGADEQMLRDPERFLYVEPEDRAQLAYIVEHMAAWQPNLVIVDSIGELMPLYGAGSNDADDFTTVHTKVLKPLAKAGAAVVTIDHLSKGADSRAYGPTGTAAKRRAIGGTSIRVKVDVAFTPDKGGSAYLSIHKDRHGGLRKNSPVGDKEPLAGKFSIIAGVAKVQAPQADDRNPDEAADAEDVAAIEALNPPPTSANDARERLHWRATRARTAFKAWKEAS